MTENNNNQPLIADILLPEIEKQLIQDDSLWPNIKGLYVIHITKKKQPMATWYFEVIYVYAYFIIGNTVQPIITTHKDMVKRAKVFKVKTIKIQVEDHDLLNFITGGMTGVKAYMAGRIKVRGDLVLAQKLEEVFEKAGGREVHILCCDMSFLFFSY
ncbi:uncharacterized protein RHIMIDRAFT_209408 [Rhizopus microsporus ATCC 52813]|uniref:SCP2 domain-containing protein n=1 Tax=Rhizopus microsporus ATCC 52813 TaxID=1340429 RepID=A0A2G4SEZ8_RHIZD|nr:uncharacterized protein RHIMIDRAFT_209408 [Rhizopus microsporus ATCC 52813]PHZ07352.1 hypothetical protein RHIMIDRAFT_209408 [Rhizopus microsporus ATCC 52813]